MSLFRTALQASEERIARLDEGGLNGILLKAQAYVARANVGELIVNTQPRARAGDEGADGMSSAPPAPDAWLGAVATCWQFKSDRAGEPAELAGEVIKPIPKRTLENGGRYVVVCSASTRGDLGEKARLEKLQEEARSAGIPADRIEVIGSERLTTWCNQHPAIAATLAGRPPALWTLSEWTRSDEQASSGIDRLVAELRRPS